MGMRKRVMHGFAECSAQLWKTHFSGGPFLLIALDVLLPAKDGPGHVEESAKLRCQQLALVRYVTPEWARQHQQCQALPDSENDFPRFANHYRASLACIGWSLDEGVHRGPP